MAPLVVFSTAACSSAAPRAKATRVLDRIIFPSGHDGAPSWSWMSYRGGIDSIPVEGSAVEWKHVTLEPRRKQDANGFAYAGPKTLVARARGFHTMCATVGPRACPAS